MVDEKIAEVTHVGLDRLGIYVIGLKTTDKNGRPVTIYDEPFIISELNCKNFVSQQMNNPSFPYYYDFDNRFLFCVGYISQSDMHTHINLVPEVIGTLQSYVSKSLRKYQQTLQTLNYCPKGYFRMSEQQKKEIQEQLDTAIIEYVEKYVIPDIDTSNIDKHSDVYKESLNQILSLTKSDN